MLNLLASAAFSRNLVKEMLRCKGSRRAVSGPTCAYPWGFCNLQGLCFHSNSQAESWSSWGKEAGLQPILPISRIECSRNRTLLRLAAMDAPPVSPALGTERSKVGCSSRIGCSGNRTLLRLAAMDAPPVSHALGTERSKFGSDGCSSRIGCSGNRTLLRLAAMDVPPVSDAVGTERY